MSSIIDAIVFVAVIAYGATAIQQILNALAGVL